MCAAPVLRDRVSMATSQTLAPRAAAPSRTRRVPLGRRGRQATLVVHLVSAGTWIGVDVVVAVLVLTGRFGDDPVVRGLAYESLALFVVWPMFAAGLVCLASGVLLGLGSTWGLVRYWWVAVKLALNVVLCLLVLVALRPGMDDVRAYGREVGAAGQPDPAAVADMFFPPAVSLTALTFANVLAVAKPWGRVRGTRSRRRS